MARLPTEQPDRFGGIDVLVEGQRFRHRAELLRGLLDWLRHNFSARARRTARRFGALPNREPAAVGTVQNIASKRRFHRAPVKIAEIGMMNHRPAELPRAHHTSGTLFRGRFKPW